MKREIDPLFSYYKYKSIFFLFIYVVDVTKITTV